MKRCVGSLRSGGWYGGEFGVDVVRLGVLEMTNRGRRMGLGIRLFTPHCREMAFGGF